MASKKNGGTRQRGENANNGKLEKLGALWLGLSARGTKYMSGVVTIDGVDHRIVVFKNGFKEADKHPDYVIYASEPQEKTQPASTDAASEDIPF